MLEDSQWCRVNTRNAGTTPGSTTLMNTIIAAGVASLSHGNGNNWRGVSLRRTCGWMVIEAKRRIHSQRSRVCSCLSAENSDVTTSNSAGVKWRKSPGHIPIHEQGTDQTINRDIFSLIFHNELYHYEIFKHFIFGFEPGNHIMQQEWWTDYSIDKIPDSIHVDICIFVIDWYINKKPTQLLGWVTNQ